MSTKEGAYAAYESEGAALGAAIYSPGALVEVLTLSADDFYDARHKALYEAVRAVYAAHGAVDMMAVIGELEGREQLETLISSPYIIQLCTDALPSTVHIHTAAIRQASKRRTLSRECQSLLSSIGRYDVDPDKAVADFLSATRGVDSGDKLYSCTDALMEFCDRQDELRKGSRERRGYTGITALDEKMGGFFGPKLIVVGARPGTGKTAFALGTAMETSNRGYRTLFVNIEMKNRDMIARAVANLAGVNIDRIDQGNLTDDEYMKMGSIYQEIANMKITWAPTANTPDKIRAAIAKTNKDNDLALVIVDYVRYMRSGKRTANQREEMSEISRSLVEIAHDTDIPVLAIVQVNRDSQKIGSAAAAISRAPTMAELRDTGAWEEDADAIFLLFAPDDNSKMPDRQREYYDQCKRNGMTYVQIEAAKVRQGQKGRYHAAFDGAHMRMRRISN